MRLSLVLILVALAGGLLYAKGEEYPGQGTLFQASVGEKRADVYSSPSVKAIVVAQLAAKDDIVVVGMSEERQTIGSYSAFWFRVSKPSTEALANVPLGWVFGKFLDVPGDLQPTVFSVMSSEADSLHGGAALLTIETNGSEYSRQLYVYPDHFGSQRFYTFTWDDFEDDFNYQDVPGTYAWFPDTNEIRHITYLGSSDYYSDWVQFTDDFQYAMEGFGSAPGIRGLAVWRVSDEGQVYIGSYFEDIRPLGHSITVAVEHSRTEMDTVVGLYRLNLDSGAKEFIAYQRFAE